MEKTTLIKKVVKGHERQVKLSFRLAKVGYNTGLGKLFRLQAYYRDALVTLRAWRDVLYVGKEQIGSKFFLMDQAIMHTDHAQVKALMQVDPQVRGNDLGIIRILAPSYLLDNPLSLGTNGLKHTGLRAVFQLALPDPFEQRAQLDSLIDEFLSTAAEKGALHIGDDLPKFVVDLLHQMVFKISLSDEEIASSCAYIKGLALASLPDFVSRYLLWFKTGSSIRHRKQLVQKYQKSPLFATYLKVGEPYGLNSKQIANSLFDAIHIAGTAGTSALLGSVIGVMCLDEALKDEALKDEALKDETLCQTSTLHNAVLETARLYPPVRFVSQLSTESGEVELGGQKCPFQKGTRLLGSIFTANHDGNRYDRPDEFSTERDFFDLLSWNGRDTERACPGKSLSIELIKLFCLALFNNYQWTDRTEVVWDFEKVTAVTPNTLILQNFAAKS